jgi:threonine dehydratase
VHVLCTVETRDRAHIREIQHRLADNGVELSNGETALTMR